MDYGISKTVPLGFEQAVEKVTGELKKEGFGVLTTIDLQQTLKNKLGVDLKKYVILGACNPPFAFRALQADENIGLLLPCNVIVAERSSGTVVAAFNPQSMLEIAGGTGIGPIADEVTARLERVIAAV